MDQAVGAGAVPGHADEERTVVTVVGWPPGLRLGHDGLDFLFDCGQIEFLELLGVVERRTHRVAAHVVLVQDAQVELVRPPIAVGGVEAGHLTVVERALGFGGHSFLRLGGFLRASCQSGCELFASNRKIPPSGN